MDLCYLFILSSYVYRPNYKPATLFSDTADLVTNQILYKRKYQMPFVPSLMNHFQEGRLCKDMWTKCWIYFHYSLPMVSTGSSTISGCGFYCPCTCICIGEFSCQCIGLNVCVLSHSGQQFPLRRLYWQLHGAPGGLRDSICALDSHLRHLHKHQLCQHQGARLTVEHESY